MKINCTTYNIQHNLLWTIVLDFLHPNGADLLLVLRQHLRQRLPSLRIFLEQIKTVALVGLAWNGFGC